ncbi:MAG: hypothetical protein IPK33_00400 [Gemmatimonadetes bacterium]|nr:hypothetical protein [Gemmatimonadota bacterium]
MLTVAEASARSLAGIAPLGIERVPLLDAVGRVLARDAVASYTLPHWDNSAMDGYAVRGADLAGASAQSPVRLAVQETVAAGEFPTKPVREGVCTRIMTGAPLPDGADTVVRVEDTDGGLDLVSIRDARDLRKNIRPRGEDFVAHDTVIPAGTPIAPAPVESWRRSASLRRRPSSPGGRHPRLRRRAGRPGPVPRGAGGAQDRDLQLVHDQRPRQEQRRDPAVAGERRRHAGVAACAAGAGHGGRPDHHLGRRLGGGVRLHARGAGLVRGAPRLLEGAHAPRGPHRLRHTAWHAVGGAAGESGERDGHVRALRAPRPPAAARARPPVSPSRPRRPRRAGEHRGTPHALPARDRAPGRGRAHARTPHRSAGVGDPHVDGPRQRAARRPRGSSALRGG